MFLNPLSERRCKICDSFFVPNGLSLAFNEPEVCEQCIEESVDEDFEEDDEDSIEDYFEDI